MSDQNPEGFRGAEDEISPEIAQRVIALCEEMSSISLAGVVVLAVHSNLAGLSIYGGGRGSDGLIQPMTPRNAAETAIDCAGKLQKAIDAGVFS